MVDSCKRCSVVFTEGNKKPKSNFCRACYSIKNREAVDRYQKSDKAKEKATIRARKRCHTETYKKYQRMYFSSYRKLPKYKEYMKEYRKEYEQERLSTDILFKLIATMRCRTRKAIKVARFKKNQGIDQYLGCTSEFLKQHLESLFQPGMTWENHSFEGWHIDHIVPLASATTEEELYKLCHYTNLQPLWAKDNLSKGSR